MSLYTFIKKNNKFLFVIWLLLIIIVSSIPRLPILKIKTSGSSIRLDYLIHFLEYFILSVFFFLWRMNNTRLKFNKILLYVAIGICFAFIDETYQILIPGRKFNMVDLLFDSFGFSVGIFLIFFITLVHLKNSSEQYDTKKNKKKIGN